MTEEMRHAVKSFNWLVDKIQNENIWKNFTTKDRAGIMAAIEDMDRLFAQIDTCE